MARNSRTTSRWCWRGSCSHLSASASQFRTFFLCPRPYSVPESTTYAAERRPFACIARLAVFFGALAALLVAVGLYGTLANRVSRRTIEIGVRLALGAPGSLDGPARQLGARRLRTPYRSAAWLASKLMASLLYKLSPHDPLSLIAAAIGVVAVSTMAALIPARRAASVEPMQALRTE